MEVKDMPMSTITYRHHDLGAQTNSVIPKEHGLDSTWDATKINKGWPKVSYYWGNNGRERIAKKTMITLLEYLTRRST